MTAAATLSGCRRNGARFSLTTTRSGEHSRTLPDISPRLIEGMAYTVTRKEVKNVKVKTKVKAADVVMGFWE